jgi:hypothetical protein
MRPRVLRTPTTWLRVTRGADRAFVFYVGAVGEREPYRAFTYPPQELPTENDALELAAALVQAPPMLSVVSVSAAWVDLAHAGDDSPIVARVRSYPLARGAYQLPVRDREALRYLARTAAKHVGAHVEPFHEAEARNLAIRLERALGAI